jgi:hypothetical protein
MTAMVRDLWNLVTTDAVTLSAAATLALALLGLLLLVCWPPRQAGAATARSAAARALVAAGLPTPDVARQTGLSRDAIGLIGSSQQRAQRQNPPSPARPAWRFGFRTR